MQSSAAVPSTQPSPTFAGLLAAFTDPQKKFPPAQDEGCIADDIVTLSYEHALRDHARYRSAEDSVGGQGSTAGPDSRTRALPVSSSEPFAARADAASPSGSALIEKNLKRASITIRLSQSDCAQLHQRAAEAGLSMSAYLRSCTLEVESLRAQVKATLAQLRSATSSQNTRSQATSSQAPSSGNKPSSSLRNAGSRLWSKLWLHSRVRVIPPEYARTYSTCSTRHFRYSVSGRFKTTGWSREAPRRSSSRTRR
jgi:hypothetical protein